MYPFRCKSPECQATGRTWNTPIYLPKRDDPEQQCPHCGTGRYLQKTDIVHLLIHDANGLIPGSQYSRFARTPGNRFSPACERLKAALQERGGNYGRCQFTVLPEAVTCYDCKLVLDSLKFVGHAESGLYLPAASDELE